MIELDNTNEKKQYAAFSIPRRDALPEKEVPVKKPNPADSISFTESGFAEIEFDFCGNDTQPGGSVRIASPSQAPVRPATPSAPARVGSSSSASAQPITQRPVDPIRERIYNMRSLASVVPFARNDPGLFRKQAKFMEDFSDDYRGSAQFFMHYPCFQYMSYEQLRTYFTWRTGVRRGQMLPITTSYLLLYIYELLSLIGVSDPAEGLIQLMAVWNAYREKEGSLDAFLPGWLKDYHIYYSLPHTFANFVAEHDLGKYFHDLLLFDLDSENSLLLWNGLSSYDVTESKFYLAGNEKLMEDYFAAVLQSVRELCAAHGCHIDDLLTNGLHKGINWSPFQRAIFYPWLKQPDREVQMPVGEAYLCRNNRWAASMVVPYANRRELVGYLLKKTEEIVRKTAKFKFKITVNHSQFPYFNNKLRALNIPLKELDETIERAITDFHKDSTRTVVTVDHENLARIRIEALGTQDKLIVPEDAARPVLPPIILEEIEEKEASPSFPDAQIPPIKTAMDEWAALKTALSTTELEALSAILRGEADLKQFADEHGVMLEVLADGINEKAMDYVGDNLLELLDGMTLYEDYLEKVSEMVG